MDDKRKDTRSYAQENLEVPLYGELPLVGRRNGPKKKNESNYAWKPRDSAHSNLQCHPMVDKELSSIRLESKKTNPLDDI